MYAMIMPITLLIIFLSLRKYGSKEENIMTSVWIAFVSLLWAGVALSGCAPPRNPIVIEPSLQPYVTAFASQYAYEYGQDLDVSTSVSYGVIEQPNSNSIVIGRCVIDDNDNRSIVINLATWILMAEELKEQLMFHELGHCELGRIHDDSVVNGLPISLMNAYEIGYNVYHKYRDRYIHELFHPGEF